MDDDGEAARILEELLVIPDSRIRGVISPGADGMVIRVPVGGDGERFDWIDSMLERYDNASLTTLNIITYDRSTTPSPHPPHVSITSVSKSKEDLLLSDITSVRVQPSTLGSRVPVNLLEVLSMSLSRKWADVVDEDEKEGEEGSREAELEAEQPSLEIDGYESVGSGIIEEFVSLPSDRVLRYVTADL